MNNSIEKDIKKIINKYENLQINYEEYKLELIFTFLKWGIKTQEKREEIVMKVIKELENEINKSNG